MQNRPRSNRFFSLAAFGITITYLVISVIWIMVSGEVAVLMANTSDLSLDKIELVKGLGFVLATSILLYVLIQHSLNRHYQNEYKTSA
ncbi:MAG: hypothetical protein WD750_11930 [Gammaproteobacteria bacterium]